MIIETLNSTAFASSTPSSIAALSTGTITGSIFDAITGYIAFIVINSNISFYYKKLVMTKNFTSLKLEIKEILWIGKILFTDILDAWNYMLGISDN